MDLYMLAGLCQTQSLGTPKFAKQRAHYFGIRTRLRFTHRLAHMKGHLGRYYCIRPRIIPIPP